VTGSRSKIQRTPIRERYEAHLADPKLLDMRNQVAWLKALAEDWVERYEAGFGGLLKIWPQLRHELTQLTNPPQEDTAAVVAESLEKLKNLMSEEGKAIVGVPDILDGRRVFVDITTAAERLDRIANRSQVTFEAVLDLQEQMAMILMREARREFESKEKADQFSARIAKLWDSLGIGQA
jgi:hypothetical protein